MAKDIGMTIRKGIVVSFLPCLVAFWEFHSFHFFYVFLLLSLSDHLLRSTYRALSITVLGLLR